MNIPFMFCRYRACTPENGLSDNTGRGEHMTAIVKLALFDMTFYDSGWMNDPDMSPTNKSSSDYTLIPDVDLCHEKFVFDGDSALENEKAALRKMKELWAKVEIED